MACATALPAHPVAPATLIFIMKDPPFRKIVICLVVQLAHEVDFAVKAVTRPTQRTPQATSHWLITGTRWLASLLDQDSRLHQRVLVRGTPRWY